MDSWAINHLQSEQYALEAEACLRKGDQSGALQRYKIAAKAEERAIAELRLDKARTLGVTVVSAVSLYFKALEFAAAEALADKWLQTGTLQSWAVEQLEELKQAIEKARMGK